MLFGYFSSTLEVLYFLFDTLIQIVEVDSTKRKQIMGVCDLNY